MWIIYIYIYIIYINRRFLQIPFMTFRKKHTPPLVIQSPYSYYQEIIRLNARLTRKSFAAKLQIIKSANTFLFAKCSNVLVS